MTKNKFKLSELLTQFSKTAADDGGTLYQQAANTVAQTAGADPAAAEAAPVEAPVEEVPVPVEEVVHPQDMVAAPTDTVGAKAVDALKEIAMEASALEQEVIQKEASEFGKIFAQSFMEEMGMNKMAREDVLMQAMNESYQATINFIKAAQDTPPEQYPSNAIAQYHAGLYRGDVNEGGEAPEEEQEAAE